MQPIGNKIIMFSYYNKVDHYTHKFWSKYQHYKWQKFTFFAKLDLKITKIMQPAQYFNEGLSR